MARRAAERLMLLAVAIPLGMGTVSRNREYSSSLTLAQTVVDRYPTSDGHHELASQLIKAGRREEAMAQLRLAIPGAPRANFTLGAELFEQGRLDEAISEFQLFLEKQPLLLEAVSARELLGRAFAKQGRWQEAVDQYRQVLPMNPSPLQSTETHLVLGDALYAIESFGGAIDHYRRYLQMRPNSADGFNKLAIVFVRTGRMADAISAF